VGLLIRQCTGFHGTKFRSQQLSIAAADPKCNEGAGIPNHCRSDGFRELVGVLVGEAEVQLELAGFGKERRKGLRAECLKFVYVDEERHALMRWKRATAHGEELKVRYQKGPEQVGCLLPYSALGQVGDENTALVHGEGEVEPRRDLTKDQTKLR